ncbi:MAG: hypothetical protein HY360_02425 [Verrucomicrobia bacterium]|nr:hypothetical protein [Verrucomicrobiota bacterium]
MAETLVRSWLENYMFKGAHDGRKKAADIAEWLADHKHFKSHGRHIPRQELESRHLNIRHLETDQTLQDLALSVFHATTHVFSATGAVKIVENHHGKAFIKQAQPLLVQVPQPSSA